MSGRRYLVDVFHDGNDSASWWSAEGGLDGNSSGVEYEAVPTLAELVEQVAGEVEKYRRRWPELKVRWTYNHGAPEPIREAARQEGIELPQ